MTKEETIEAIRIMQAWVDGKEIICENNPQELDDGSDPFWNWEGWVESYRIKTKTVKYVKKASEIIKWLEDNGYRLSDEGYWSVTGFDGSRTVLFQFDMFQYCGKELPTESKYYWHPDWIEEREVEL